MVSPWSFANVRDKWVPEVRKYCPNTPIVIAGNKTDLMDDPDVIKDQAEVITIEQGMQLAAEVAAEAFVPISALTQENLSVLFGECVRAALDPPANARAWTNPPGYNYYNPTATSNSRCVVG
eukprot:TRINITY_DN7120_c0_g1_i1.p1 TRINITY_DN7120_c0_g1~~TRINITY_DN7120_c0_g1_i1.p1  ORF type:complete len:122 (-),score=12.72 TRINITY_DN7120_c0_g1_i1:24-389(-)